jgi:lysophospholipase L1-like esterase
MATTEHGLPVPDGLGSENNPPADFEALALAIQKTYGGSVNTAAELPSAGAFEGQRIWLRNIRGWVIWDGVAWVADARVDSLAVVAGALVVEMTDGTVRDLGPLPVGPGGTPQGIADALNDDDGPAGEALAARVAVRVGEQVPGFVEAEVAAVSLLANPSTTGVQAGDSFTDGTGASTSAKKWANIFKIAKRLTGLVNVAVGGSMVWDQAAVILQRAVALGDTNTMLLGFNDQRIYGSNASRRQVWSRSYLAMAWWLATVAAAKIYYNDPRVTLGGSGGSHWAGAGAYDNLGGVGQTVISSKSVGDYVDVKITGRVGYIMSLAQNDNAATYSIEGDGVQRGIYSAFLDVPTHLGKSYGPVMHRVEFGTDAEHTIRLKVETIPNAASTVFFVVAGGSARQRDEKAPMLACGTLSRCTSAGYAVNPAGASDATTAAYNDVIASVVNQLAADGLNVALAHSGDTRPSTDTWGDGVHPNDAGHAFIAQAFVEALAQHAYARERRGVAGQGQGFVGCKLYRTTAWPLPSGAWTPIPWDAEDWDTHGFHDPNTNPGRITIPTGMSGFYHVSGNVVPVSTMGNSGNRVIGGIHVNGVAARGGDSEGAGGTFAAPNAGTMLYLAAGDYVELRGYQDTGSDKNIGTTSALSLHRVAGPLNGVWDKVNQPYPG